MKIVIYQTFSSATAEGGLYTVYLPERSKLWDKLAEDHPEHEFVLAICYNEYGLLDARNGKITETSSKVPYVLMPVDASIEELADIIADQKPDLAISLATPDFPHDWNSIRDSLVAEQLEKKGIKTVSYSTFTSLSVFDKWRTNIVLRLSKVKIAKGVYVHADLFWSEKKNPGMKCNVFKEYVLQRTKEMNYPIIIKDAVGAGSIGLQVCDNYEKAKQVLLENENMSDVMVEEMIQGEPFGTEIHGVPGHYSVLPPVQFSTNDEGVIDPWSNIKYGPITNEKYHIKELQEMLRDLAEKMKLQVTAQVDLIFKDGEWYIIEINPRWSGSSTVMAAMENRSIFTMFAESGLGIGKDYSDPANLCYVLNFKSPDMDEETRRKMLAEYPCIKSLSKIHLPVSETESKDYCEIVIGGFATKDELMDTLLDIEKNFKGTVSDSVIENVKKISKDA